MAKVIKEFKGAPDDSSYVKTFVPGDAVFGDLAKVAIANRWATEEDAKAGASSGEGGGGADNGTPKTAAEVLALAEDMKENFMGWKALAGEVLGADLPAKKADIIAALELRAEEDAKAGA